MQAKIADGVYLSQGNVRKLEQFSKGASQLARAARRGAASGRRRAVGRWRGQGAGRVGRQQFQAIAINS